MTQQSLPLADAAAVRAWLGRMVRRYRSPFLAMTALYVAAAGFGLVGPQLLGHLVERVTAGEPVAVDLLAGVFLAVLVAQAILIRLARMRATVFGEHLLAEAREGFIGSALQIDIGTVEAAGTGDLLSRATTDVDRIEYAARDAAPLITTSAITLLLTVGAMVLTSPLLAAAALLIVPLTVLVTRWYWRRANPVLERMLWTWSDVQASTTETVNGARAVETLRLAGRRRAHDERMLATAVRTEHEHRSLLVRWLPTLELSYLVPVAVVLAVGAWAYDAGLVGIGAITAVLLYVLATAGPLVELLVWVEELQVGGVGLRRILGIGTVADDTADSADPPRRGRGTDVTLRGVRFGYVADRAVLHGIDLAVPAGQRLAIVGPSGSGKSTLARLIAGLAEPDSGAVQVGGVDVAALPARQRRALVLLLTQEHHVFATTLRENLLLHDDAISDDRLRQALVTVGAGAWLEALPDGLDTVLGAGAEPVPPAAAQQIALARVVLADPPVVVLDEAMSAMDRGSARATEHAVTSALAGRTVIMIAHRISTARAADQVVVLADGRIVEAGTDAELVAAGGSYAALVTAAGTTVSGHR